MWLLLAAVVVAVVVAPGYPTILKARQCDLLHSIEHPDVGLFFLPLSVLPNALTVVVDFVSWVRCLLYVRNRCVNVL